MKSNVNNIEIVLSEHLTRQHGENRFVIMEVETHKILENNKGEGFRSKNKAYAHYCQKHNIPFSRLDN